MVCYVDHNLTGRTGQLRHALSFLDMKHLLDIKPNGRTYIYSACDAFSEEMEIDFKRLWHWLKRFNINSCGFSLDNHGVPSFEKCYHASGHASGEDITWAIEQIDPDYIIPIHTESRDWSAKSFENVILVDEGRPYEF